MNHCPIHIINEHQWHQISLKNIGARDGKLLQCNLVCGTDLIFVVVIRLVSNDQSVLRKFQWLACFLKFENSFRRGTTVLAIN